MSSALYNKTMKKISQKKLYKSTQEKRLSVAISLAGARYTPKLNVEVSIASVFDGLGRTAKFYEELKSPANEIIKNLRSIKDEEVSKVAPKEFEKVKRHFLEVVNFLLKIPHSGVAKIDFKKIYSISNNAKEAAYKCTHLLRENEEENRKKKEQENPINKPKKGERITYIEDEKFRNEKHHLYKIGSVLSSLIDFSKSNTALAANNPRVLLNGIAGSGKTHFLCDLSKYRISHGLPTFIFLGEEFNNSKNPWGTAKNLLAINTSNKTFIQALNDYAGAKRTRAIIVVDAVNESQVFGVHWEQFNLISRYKNLGVILSIRSGFEQSELPLSVLKSYVRVEHEGFATHEWEALTKFFTEYKLPLPEVPILFPEFRIPLFLKIFCEASAKSPEPIKGHRGFTHIFEKYVITQGDAVLKKLGESGESVRRIWNGTIKELALYMGENGTDRIPEKQAVSIAAKQFPSKGKKVLWFLEKYWLITKVPRYKKYKIIGFDYRFPYQKFSDHLIVRNLLTKHLNTTLPKQSLKKGTRLGNIIGEQWNRGLIEALSIQVPERLRGRELVYVAPNKFRYQEIAKDSFLESLIWRDLSLKKGKTKYINQRRILNYLNKYILPYYGGNEKILETLITVSAIPSHPLNAKLLHRHLAKKKMPQRDAFWLPFINSRYGDEGAINRLLTWSWDGGDKSTIQNDSLRLAGVTLAWFLASSNRFLRDRATKALVSMLNGRIPVLLKVLEDFKGVDDPYIQERLYAAAYGCVLQPENKREDVSTLALYTYNNIFKDRKPPTHILLRDYARGIMELAISQDATLKNKIDIRRIRPPYGSSFPTVVPTLADLKKKYPKGSGRKRKNGDYGAIWYSLMYNNEGGIADFGNYVVGSTLNHWCNLRLSKNGKRKKTIKEIDAEFNTSLNRIEKKRWKKIESMRQSTDWQLRMTDFPRREGDQLPENKFMKEQLKEAETFVKNLEKVFIETLSDVQQKLYKKGVLPYRENPKGSDDLNDAEIQRLIFQRIVQLGWRPKLFAKYDSTVREMGRDAHKSERIGKKYQWIAFHEVLGRIADNFVYRGAWRDTFEPYQGTWQMCERDIDPSCLLHKTPIDSSAKKPWWISAVYKHWRPSLNHTQWTKVKNDLPTQKNLIEIKSKGGWLLLDGYVRWEQPPVPGEEKFDKIRRDVWYILRSYIVKKKEVNRMFAWAKKQDFMGRWMPDPLELRSLFLREIPNSIAYQNEYNVSNKKRWIKVEDKERKITPFNVIKTTEEYHWEGSGFDCSLEEGLAIHIPAKELIKGMNIHQSKESGKFINKKGEVVAQDPSVADAGSGALIIKKKPLIEFLKKNGYEIIWAVIGEKLLLGTMGSGEGFLGRLEMGGAFRMKVDGKLVGKTYTNVLPPHKK
ncbi:MAG: hypothetical protein UV01_C0005G0011 [Parcubacteria group bacterium GW2011_GWA2_42_14]|nr:MAG: hypothetical protein UV01_C0005G0011 [Parcubacteria group bacterium GW2011_GWA2_42_14]